MLLEFPSQRVGRTYQQIQHSVYDKRWGTAMAATGPLADLMPGLRSGWNRLRYSQGVGGAGAPAEEDKGASTSGS